MIDWRRICLPTKDGTTITHAPVERDGYTYITDGHRAYRFDRGVTIESIPTNDAPHTFRFDGGYAIVMPMRGR